LELYEGTQKVVAHSHAYCLPVVGCFNCVELRECVGSIYIHAFLKYEAALLMMKKEKILEAILVITTGFIVLFAVLGKEWMLFVAIASGLVGLLIPELAAVLAKVWFKIGEVLGFVVSKVVLFLLFYVLLTPIAFLYRLFNQDSLQLKRQNRSLWSERNHIFQPTDLKNSW